MDDEFTRIKRWTNDLGGPCADIVVDVGDDGAVVRPHPDKELVLTCDSMIETVHFAEQTMDPYSIGWKALVANVSDIAAMGAQARWALVALHCAPAWTDERLDKLYAGMRDCASAYGVRIVGGDTIASPEYLAVHVTMVGEVEAGRSIVRSGACVGDVVFVTGSLGGSAAGLALLQRAGVGSAVCAMWKPPGDAVATDEGALALEAMCAELIRSHRMPVARANVGAWLGQEKKATALNDVSDGLASEAWELAEASQVHIALARERLPYTDAVRHAARWLNVDPLTWVLYGGEDYELLGTASPQAWNAIVAYAVACGVAIHDIGRVVAGSIGVSLVGEEGSVPLSKGGYNHFGVR